MVSDRAGARRRAAAPSLALALLWWGAGASCATDEIRRFPLRDPLWIDPDANQVEGPIEKRETSGAGQLIEQTVLRPLSHGLTLPLPTESLNVNSFDEVPDSSWFTNRIGRGAGAMTADEIARGACGDAPPLDPSRGPWMVTSGKFDGTSLGFVIRTPDGARYLIKFDGWSRSERATTADVVGSKIYFAAGYHTPCNQVVSFSEDILQMDPAAKRKDRYGRDVPLTRSDLEQILAIAWRRADGRLRASASRYLSGSRLGPFRYEGTRADDPNDVIPHERRRELRGSKLLAAWIHHWDANENNTLDMLVDEGGRRFVRHYLLDWSDSLGDIWAWSWERFNTRIGTGRSGYFDLDTVAIDLVSLGLYPRPWTHVPDPPEPASFGYFGTDGFVPSRWRGTYGNPAFKEITPGDALWAARIIARFDDAAIAAVVASARMEDGHDAAFVAQTLRGRRDIILREAFAGASPLADFQLRRAAPSPASPETLCFRDLAVAAGVADPTAALYQIHFHSGARLENLLGWRRLRPDAAHPADTCVDVPLGRWRPSAWAGAAAPDADPRRYGVIEIYNSGHSLAATGSVRVHLYDLGPARGFRIVGIERPEHAKDPP